MPSYGFNYHSHYAYPPFFTSSTEDPCKLQVPQYYCPLFSCFHSSHRNLKRSKSKLNLSFLSDKSPLLLSVLVKSKHHLPGYQSHRTESHPPFFLVHCTFPLLSDTYWFYTCPFPLHHLVSVWLCCFIS